MVGYLQIFLSIFTCNKYLRILNEANKAFFECNFI